MKSGTFNKLSEMLFANNTFIIPDLQRDYCWGHVKTKDKDNTLAFNFCNELIEKAKKTQNQDTTEISYGIIYTYEYPSTFYYLSDGQQRITTLYLIIGVLNHYLSDNRLRKMLVTSLSQPRLKYEVRNSTDYFINHLVQEVFLSSPNQKDLKNIQKANWFRDEFYDDPSINSILKALKYITHVLTKKDALLVTNFLIESIGFVLVNLQANTVDLKGSFTHVREYGEKMYEIVNTRGNPMEPNEHLKVKLLSKLESDIEKEKWTEIWELWQDVFWQHRAPGHETSDDGFNQFITWIERIEGKSSHKLELKEIEDYFKSLFLLISFNKRLHKYNAEHQNVTLFNIETELHKKKPANQIVILSALIYLKGANYVSYSYDEGYLVNTKGLEIESVFRFLRFFTNIARKTDSIELTMQLASCLHFGEDITKLINYFEIFNSLNMSEEVYKLSLLKNADASKRDVIEDALWMAEDHKFINGKLEPFFNWLNIDFSKKSVDEFDIANFLEYFKAFDFLFNDELSMENMRFFLLANNPNWDIFREGWSWGAERFYLGTKEDITFWSKNVSNPAFKIIVEAQILGKFSKKFTMESVMNQEDVTRRKIIRKLIHKASSYWQWRHKRFFIHDDSIRLPNGRQAKSYTASIEL